MAASSRKRAPAAEEADEEPLIVQMSGARPTGCATCWTSTEMPRLSARLAVKKPKRAVVQRQTEGLEGEPPIGVNEFVYKTCGLRSPSYARFSPDARYMYAFTNDLNLLVIDLFHGTQKIFKAPEGRKNRYIGYFVPLNAPTILLMSKVYGSSNEADSMELELLRIGECGDVFEPVLLMRETSSPFRMFVFAEISGQTDVKHVVFGRHGTVAFCRLNVDEGRLETFHSLPIGHFPRIEDFHEPAFPFHVSEDGRQLYTMQSEDPKALHVYSLKDRKWTTTAIEMGDWESDRSFTECFWSTGVVYAKGRAGVLFRCDLDEKIRKRVPIDGQNVAFLLPLCNPVDGADDALVLLKEKKLRKKKRGQERRRYTIQRFMQRNVDSLRVLAMAATRKSREGVGGAEAFYEKMAVRTYKSVLPTAFANMQSIPIHCRRCCDRYQPHTGTWVPVASPSDALNQLGRLFRE